MNETIEILLVEDNPDDAALMRAYLAVPKYGKLVMTHVPRLQDALARLERETFGVVLLDLGLPDSDGLATLKSVRNRARQLPIIVLTGMGDEVLAIRAMQEGAQDYLVKGEIDANTTVRAIRYAVERKRAEEAFHTAEQWLGVAVESAKMGVWDWNITTDRLVWAHHHAALFGLKPEEFDGRYETFEKCIHPDDRAKVSKAFAKSIGKQQDYYGEYRVVWPDGTIRWIEGRGRVFRDAEGRVVRITGTVVDTTERKAADEAARRREAELAHLSRISTVGHMAAGFAHELNQPLSAILNYASVCESQLQTANGGSREMMTSALNGLMNETRRAGAIISRLRSFMRNEEPHRLPLDINALIEEALDLLHFELRHQAITPRLNLVDTPKVLADPVQIEQVLVNLIYNALEAMDQETCPRKELIIETDMQADGSAVQVRIIDRGCGVAPQNMPQLFESFFTTKANGLGMGLKISRSIVESHGGNLTASPNAEGGMTFCFTLAVAEGDQL